MFRLYQTSAAFHYQEIGYFIWGVDDKTHQIVGTSFNQYQDFQKEPFQGYLARNLSPSINFEFKEIETKPSEYRELTFHKLFGYYGSRGIVLKEETFEKNLHLRNNGGDYNIMAQLLSDNSHIPLRVSIFDGTTKAAPLFSVREFGNNCLLYSLDSLLQYGDVLNIIQADEENRVVERKEVPLFDSSAFREAVINAVLHNFWVAGNEPMFSVFSDRIEILSRGTLAPGQTVEGFYLGESIPVNEKLSEIFLQLHISEKSGRGVPIIVSTYGKDAITFRENSILVTIPFTRIQKVDKKVGKKVDEKVGESTEDRPPLNPRRKAILLEMTQNPMITEPELASKLGISVTAIDNNISFLKKNKYLERIGKRGGYWKVL